MLVQQLLSRSNALLYVTFKHGNYNLEDNLGRVLATHSTASQCVQLASTVA